MIDTLLFNMDNIIIFPKRIMSFMRPLSDWGGGGGGHLFKK